MGGGYTENPANFHELEPYVMSDRAQIIREIILAERCYFYDACGFRRHVHMEHPHHIFEFFKRFQGMIVITRCVLMELASHSGMLDRTYIDYIKSMCLSGLKVLVMYEEDVFDVLDLCFASSGLINDCLSWAVKVVKMAAGTMEATLKKDEELRDDIFRGNCTDRTLYRRFFGRVRRNKEAGDDLGEELIAVCIHVLSNLPENKEFKYIVMTEDKGAIGILNKTAHNLWKYKKIHGCSVLTTARLSQRLYEEKIVTSRRQLEEMLSSGVPDHRIKVFASEEYDLAPEEKTMTCGELAQKIMMSNPIHINY